MNKVRVGVLRGGTHNYEASLKTGGMVVEHLPSHYTPEHIFVARDGTWVKDGLEVKPHDALLKVDTVFNALQGSDEGTDRIKHILEYYRIPFTGTGTFASVITKHPFHTRQLLARGGVASIPYRLVEIPSDGEGEDLMTLFRSFPPPVIIRPVGIDGVYVAHTFDEFVEMMEDAFVVADQILLEERIMGTIASVYLIEGYREQELYTLPVVSKVPLSFDVKKELEHNARKAHSILGMKHYSRVDFLVSPIRGTFVTHVVPHPSLHTESTFYTSLQSVGAPVSHFLDHIIQLALHKR